MLKDIPDNLEPPKPEIIPVKADSKVMILKMVGPIDTSLFHFRRGFKMVANDDRYVAVIIDMNTWEVVDD